MGSGNGERGERDKNEIALYRAVLEYIIIVIRGRLHGNGRWDRGDTADRCTYRLAAYTLAHTGARRRNNVRDIL